MKLQTGLVEKVFLVVIISIFLGCNNDLRTRIAPNSKCNDSIIDYPNYNTNSICIELLKDTVNQTDISSKEWIIHYADSIKSYGNRKETFFPYKDFDKIIVFRLNKLEAVSHIIPKDTFYLNTCQAEILLEIINNPVYFTFAECGTPTFDYNFQFLNKNEIVEELFFDYDCDFLMTESKVKDINWQRMKYGAIVNKIKIAQIKNILIETNAYFETKD